jgi:hypothetical protein
MPRDAIFERMRLFLSRLEFALAIGAFSMCVVLHVAAFIMLLPPLWILLPFALLFGAVICSQAFKYKLRLKTRSRNWKIFGLALLLYAVLLFVYNYNATGGATSAGIVNGQYVYTYKGDVIKTITEHDYRVFPNRWTRVMSAWMGMIAAFIMNQAPIEE